jgi:hypothetical protein
MEGRSKDTSRLMLTTNGSFPFYPVLEEEDCNSIPMKILAMENQ